MNLFDDLVGDAVGEPGAVGESGVLMVEVDVRVDSGVGRDTGWCARRHVDHFFEGGRHEVDDEEAVLTALVVGDLYGSDLRFTTLLIWADIELDGTALIGPPSVGVT
jgi:hypothetical protein